jgi:hypothetical protein
MGFDHPISYTLSDSKFPVECYSLKGGGVKIVDQNKIVILIVYFNPVLVL